MKTITSCKQLLFTILIGTSVMSCCGDLCYTGVPSKAITVERATELEETFVNTRSEAIQNAIGYADTREFHYTVEELKQYLAYVEHEGKKQGYDSLGIRIYFAAYPADDGTKDAGFSTVFLAPTTSMYIPDPTAPDGVLDSIPKNIQTMLRLNVAHGGQPPTANIDGVPE